MSRLTRKEMKRDEVREWMEHVLDWCYENLRLIIQIAVGVLVALLIGAAFIAYQSNRARKANEALAEAMELFSAPVVDILTADPEGDDPTFASEEDREVAAKAAFEAVVDAYGSVDAGRVAHAYLGEIAQKEGDLAAAREHWGHYLESGDKNALASSVYLNLVNLDRAEGKADELIESLRAELEDKDGYLPDDVLLWELASTLDSVGKTEEARESYQQLLDDFPRSAYTTQAQQKIDSGS